MGNSSSRMEEDKALQLCRERKKFVRQALDGRCLLASAHVAYIQSLKTTGTALRKFIEPDGLIDPSLYTPSTNATPEPQLALSERPLSHLSFSSPSVSQRIDAAEGFSPSPSPPSSSIKFQANHMKHTSVYSKKVEEKVPVPVIGTLTSSGTPQNGSTPRYNGRSESPAFEDSTLPDGAPQWDFFGLFNPIDHQFSFQDGKGAHHVQNGDDITQLREEEGIPDLEEDEEGVSSHDEDGSQASEDEFEDEPTSEKLVQRFENLNRVNNHVQENALPATTKPLTGDVASEVELVNGEKANSPNLSPLKTVPPAVTSHPPETNKSTEKENHSQNKVIPKNFFSSMKEIESLFIEASASGKEVPRMLEANKFHFRPMFPAKENSSVASSFLKACFSCGDDPTQVPEEPAQNSVKYLTWHRTASSRSSSSRNPVGANSRDDTEAFANNLFDTSCMISGSHASTLDRLYAWERKLYDEVKASEIVRKEYDTKCKILRHLESKEKTHTIDKTRAVVKDLHSRIRVAIHRIDSISKRIEELRDKELQPQLEELIEGLSRMWEVMFECHKLQFQIISVSYNNSHAKIAMHSELHRQIISYLEDELLFLSSSLTKWIGAQKSYLEAISGWLNKCVSFKQKSTRKRRKPQSELLRDYGPPIYATCIVWLEKLDGLPVKDVVDSIKSLAADTARFLPHKEKNHGKGANHPHINGESSDNLLRDDISEDWASGFDRFRLSLIRFLGQLSSLSGASVTMYADLRQAIHTAKIIYQKRSSFSQNGHSNSQSQDVHLNSESQGDQSNSQSQVV